MATSTDTDEYLRWSREMELRTRTIRSIDDIIDGLKASTKYDDDDDVGKLRKNNNNTTRTLSPDNDDVSKQTTSSEQQRGDSSTGRQRSQLRGRPSSSTRSELNANDVIFENVSSDVKKTKNLNRLAAVESSSEKKPVAVNGGEVRPEDGKQRDRHHSSRSCFRRTDKESSRDDDVSVRRRSYSGYNPDASGVSSGNDDQLSSRADENGSVRDNERRSRKSRSFWSAFGCGSGKPGRGKNSERCLSSGSVTSSLASTPLKLSLRSSPKSIAHNSRSSSAQPEICRSSSAVVETYDNCLRVREPNDILTDPVTSDVSRSKDKSKTSEISCHQRDISCRDIKSFLTTDVDEIYVDVDAGVVDSGCDSPETLERTCVLDDVDTNLDDISPSSASGKEDLGVDFEIDLWKLNGQRLADFVCDLLQQTCTVSSSSSQSPDDDEVIRSKCLRKQISGTGRTSSTDGEADQFKMLNISRSPSLRKRPSNRGYFSMTNSPSEKSLASLASGHLSGVISNDDIAFVMKSVDQHSTTTEQPVFRTTAPRYSMPIECLNISDYQPAMTSSFSDNCSTVPATGNFNDARHQPVVADSCDGAVSGFIEASGSGEVSKAMKPVTVEKAHSNGFKIDQKHSENQLNDAQHSSINGVDGKLCSGTQRRIVGRPKRTGNAHYSFDERLASTPTRELSIWRQAAEGGTFEQRPPRPVSSSHHVTSNRFAARAKSQEYVGHLNDSKMGSALQQQHAQTSPILTNRLARASATAKIGNHRSQSFEETANETPTQSRWMRSSHSAERVDRSRSSTRKSTANSPNSPAKGNERSRTAAGRRSADGFRSPIRRRSLSREWTVVVVTTEEESIVVQTPTATPQRSLSPQRSAKSMTTVPSTDVDDRHGDGGDARTVRRVACDQSGKYDTSRSANRSGVMDGSVFPPSMEPRRLDKGEWNSIADTLFDMVDHLGVGPTDGSVPLAFDTSTTDIASSEDAGDGTLVHSNHSASILLMNDPRGRSEYPNSEYPTSKYPTTECEQIDADSFDELIASLMHFADNGVERHNEHSDIREIRETSPGKSSPVMDSSTRPEDAWNNKRASFHRQANATPSGDGADPFIASPRRHYELYTTEISDTGNTLSTYDVSTVVPRRDTTKNDDKINKQIKCGDVIGHADVTPSRVGDCEIRLADESSPIRSKATGSTELTDNASFDDGVEVGWTVNSLDDSWSGESKKIREYEVEIAADQSSSYRREKVCSSTEFESETHTELHGSCLSRRLGLDGDRDGLFNDHLDGFERRDADNEAARCIRYPTDANSIRSIVNGVPVTLGFETSSSETLQIGRTSDDYMEDDDDDVWNSASEQSQITARSLSAADEDLDSDLVDNRTEVSETGPTSSVMVERSRMMDELPARQRQTTDMDMYIEKAIVESLVGSIGTIIFLLAAALIFHVLNHFVKQEFG